MFFEPFERSFGTVIEPVFDAADSSELEDIEKLLAPDDVLKRLKGLISLPFQNNGLALLYLFLEFVDLLGD